jgi:iron(III) transport system substrate-binding protein
MKEVDKNVVQYTRSGVAPSRMVGQRRGSRSPWPITQDVEAALAQGYPLGLLLPGGGHRLRSERRRRRRQCA